VWAPNVTSLEVHASGGVRALDRGDDGVHTGRFDGGEYLLALDG
jgi:hypothetical protein